MVAVKFFVLFDANLFNRKPITIDKKNRVQLHRASPFISPLLLLSRLPLSPAFLVLLVALLAAAAAAAPVAAGRRRRGRAGHVLKKNNVVLTCFLTSAESLSLTAGATAALATQKATSTSTVSYSHLTCLPVLLVVAVVARARTT